ncbi:unnamed protein product [Rhodiola kirilowii]
MACSSASFESVDSPSSRPTEKLLRELVDLQSTDWEASPAPVGRVAELPDGPAERLYRVGRLASQSTDWAFPSSTTFSTSVDRLGKPAHASRPIGATVPENPNFVYK